MSWELQLTIAFRLIMSFFLGALVGLERTSQQKPAGSRTHALVCLASTLFMTVSIYGFPDMPGPKDPARIAAQVVTGMGFIGAGTIWKEGSWVRGLTTATTLWIASALGLAIGAGLYVPALVSIALAYIGLQFYTLKRLFTGKDEWADVMEAFERLDLGSLKGSLENIFATPITFSTFNYSDPYLVSFSFQKSLPDPFTLTLSFKEKTVSIVLLYIPESLRGKRLASSVIQSLIQWSRIHGFELINLTSKQHIEPLWVKSGFQPLGGNMYSLKL